MSERYVWGRYNFTYSKEKSSSFGGAQVGGRTVYFAICDERNISADSWNTSNYDVKQNQLGTSGTGFSVTVQANKCFCISTSEPRGTVTMQWQAREAINFYGDYGSGDGRVTLRPSNAYMLIMEANKGTADGSVSNASSSTYPQDGVSGFLSTFPARGTSSLGLRLACRHTISIHVPLAGNVGKL